ncbi:GntR family transcriptional regulator [Streptomyces hoynatensis]|uniref:GntR family transcriptional regulator n=1 Tax=Streptomyces hoynatensis TaxID=1141874 RepID=A0A3A9Z4A2_9ACTN|nr:GntR family transcriptional regulator [Streptomyces hoynatensis]RKN43113.1 GntR family transcriptional regulator [Streptomyces hoynatensis]
MAPKWQELADELRALIVNGDLKPGQTLPQIRDLVEQGKGSKTTVQAAYKALEAEGLIAPSRGHGTVVLERPVLKRLGTERYDKAKWRDGDEVAFIADRKASNRPYQRSDQTQTVSRVPAPAQVAEAHGLPAGAEVYARARLVKEQGRPTHTLTSYYRPEHVEGTRLVDPTPGPAGRGGGFRVLYEAGYEPDSMKEVLHSRMPTPQERELLQLRPGEPVVELHRTTYTADGTVIEYAIGVHAASRFSWEYRFQIPDSAHVQKGVPQK